MRGTVCPAFFVLMMVLGFALPAGADTRYVSDQLVVTLRQGKGTEYKIIRTLTTGTPVEVLSEEGNFVKARTQKGEEGYILKQYLSNKTPKKIVIARLEKEKSELEKKLAVMGKKVQELTAGLTSTNKEYIGKISQLEEESARFQDSLNQAEKKLQAVTRDYDDLRKKSENVIGLSEERDRLQNQNAQLQTKVETLQQENEKLLQTGMIKWFLAGAGALFVGWICGRIPPKKKRGGLSF